MNGLNPGLEREVKLSLSGPDEYRRLASVLPAPRRWGMQLNVYLDSADGRLRAERLSLRIRITPDHARLTMKKPADVRESRDELAGAFVNLETEVEIDRTLALAWITDPASAMPWAMAGFSVIPGHLGGEGLRIATWSITRRAICDTAWGITLELDETVFPDGFRDFEIEAEHVDARLARRVIDLHAGRAGLTLAVQGMSKHARARVHRGDGPWIIPSGQAWAAQPPLFDNPAPASWFGVEPVGYVDVSLD